MLAAITRYRPRRLSYYLGARLPRGFRYKLLSIDALSHDLVRETRNWQEGKDSNPHLTVLETAMLPLHHRPICKQNAKFSDLCAYSPGSYSKAYSALPDTGFPRLSSYRQFIKVPRLSNGTSFDILPPPDINIFRYLAQYLPQKIILS